MCSTVRCLARTFSSLFWMRNRWSLVLLLLGLRGRSVSLVSTWMPLLLYHGHLPLHDLSTISSLLYSVWLVLSLSTLFRPVLVSWCCRHVAALFASYMVVTFHVPIFEIFLEDQKSIGDVASFRLSLHGGILSVGGFHFRASYSRGRLSLHGVILPVGGFHYMASYSPWEAFTTWRHTLRGRPSLSQVQ